MLIRQQHTHIPSTTKLILFYIPSADCDFFVCVCVCCFLIEKIIYLLECNVSFRNIRCAMEWNFFGVWLLSRCLRLAIQFGILRWNVCSKILIFDKIDVARSRTDAHASTQQQQNTFQSNKKQFKIYIFCREREGRSQLQSKTLWFNIYFLHRNETGTFFFLNIETQTLKYADKYRRAREKKEERDAFKYRHRWFISRAQWNAVVQLTNK